MKRQGRRQVLLRAGSSFPERALPLNLSQLAARELDHTLPTKPRSFSSGRKSKLDYPWGASPETAERRTSISRSGSAMELKLRAFARYRRNDSQGEAGRLFDDLVTHFGEQKVFMDVAGIEAGRDFRKAIEESVANCGVLLVIIGPSWLAAKKLKRVRPWTTPPISSVKRSPRP